MGRGYQSFQPNYISVFFSFKDPTWASNRQDLPERSRPSGGGGDGVGGACCSCSEGGGACRQSASGTGPRALWSGSPHSLEGSVPGAWAVRPRLTVRRPQAGSAFPAMMKMIMQRWSTTTSSVRFKVHACREMLILTHQLDDYVTKGTNDELVLPLNVQSASTWIWIWFGALEGTEIDHKMDGVHICDNWCPWAKYGSLNSLIWLDKIEKH